MTENRWNPEDAAIASRSASNEADRDLAMRVYSSRLLGCDPDLVLHGGGNTSVKTVRTVDGSATEVIHVKGSGWDLRTIEAAGLPALRREHLDEVRHLPTLDDREMVAHLRGALLDPAAPNPSVEALLHAYLPAKFVDHAHAAAILVIANQPDAAAIAREIYGDRLAIVPYVMPGFDLSIAGDKVFQVAPPPCEGLFLVNHGVFVWGDDAKTSYERIIEFNTMAEAFLAARGIGVGSPEATMPLSDPAHAFADRLRRALKRTGATFGEHTAVDIRVTPSLLRFVNRDDLGQIASRGTATPDHVIRLKPFPLIATANMGEQALVEALTAYRDRYAAYFQRNADRSSEPKVMLDALPRVVLVPSLGTFCLGESSKAAAIVGDLVEQTVRIVLAAEEFGRFSPLNEADLFDMEYWSLEQAKLKKRD